MKIKGMKNKKKFKEGCWVLVSCYWLIVACCWLLVACHLSLVVNNGCKSWNSVQLLLSGNNLSINTKLPSNQ